MLSVQGLGYRPYNTSINYFNKRLKKVKEMSYNAHDLGFKML